MCVSQMILLSGSGTVFSEASGGEWQVGEMKLESQRLYPCTILHQSLFKTLWDWLMLVLVIMTAIFAPYDVAFDIKLFNPDADADADSKPALSPSKVVNVLIDAAFMLDILINFRCVALLPAALMLAYIFAFTHEHSRSYGYDDTTGLFSYTILPLGLDSHSTYGLWPITTYEYE